MNGRVWCLSAPDPLTNEPDIERGSTCGPSQAIQLGIGSTSVIFVPEGTRPPRADEPRRDEGAAATYRRAGCDPQPSGRLPARPPPVSVAPVARLTERSTMHLSVRTYRVGTGSIDGLMHRVVVELTASRWLDYPGLTQNDLGRSPPLAHAPGPGA